MKIFPILKFKQLVPTFLNVPSNQSKHVRSVSGLIHYGNKPLIDHLLDRLYKEEYREVCFAYSHQTQPATPSKEYGHRWGIQIKQVNFDEDRNIDLLINELRASNYTHVAIYRTTSLKRINSPEHLCSLNDGDLIYNALKQNEHALNNINLLRDIYAQNIFLLNHIDDFQINEFELGKQIFVGNGIEKNTIEPASKLKPSSNSLIVGDLSFVHKNTTISGKSCIGERCYIDEGVTLDNSVVLPNTYVGKHVNISNCIVGNSWIFNAETLGFIKIDDPQLLAVA